MVTPTRKPTQGGRFWGEGVLNIFIYIYIICIFQMPFKIISLDRISFYQPSIVLLPTLECSFTNPRSLFYRPSILTCRGFNSLQFCGFSILLSWQVYPVLQFAIAILCLRERLDESGV